VVDRAAVGLEHARAQRGGRGAQPQVDAGPVDVERGVVGAAGQQLLRQRRPVVGPVGLGADQRHPPGVALGTQLLHRAGTCQTAADHHDVLADHHVREASRVTTTTWRNWAGNRA
jgi:hypothetical protein